MKTFKQYLQEAVPTNAANANNSSGGFSSTANASGPVAGFTPKLFQEMKIYYLKIIKLQLKLEKIDILDFQQYTL